MRLKRICIILIMMILGLYGCSSKDSFKDNVVLTINDIDISIEQARFYVYNKQANYELYYLINGQVIDWDAPYEDNDSITMEDLVKTEVLEQMKKLVLVSEYAKDEGILLSSEDNTDINALVDEFISESKDTLIAKTGKNKDTLNNIFSRQKYVDMLYEKLDITNDAKAQEELYNNLLVKAKITINEKLWNSLTFDDAIYSSEDVETIID